MVSEEELKNMSPEQMAELQKQNCIFCHIVQGRVQSKNIFEDDSVVAILDINPASPGHVLLIPKEHYSIMPLVPESTLSHMFMVAKAISNACLKALKVQGTNIFVANGAIAGQKAPHFMVHVIPRKEKDGLEPIFSLKRKQISPEDQEQVWVRLKAKVNQVFGIKDESGQEDSSPGSAFPGQQAGGSSDELRLNDNDSTNLDTVSALLGSGTDSLLDNIEEGNDKSAEDGSDQESEEVPEEETDNMYEDDKDDDQKDNLLGGSQKESALFDLEFDESEDDGPAKEDHGPDKSVEEPQDKSRHLFDLEFDESEDDGSAKEGSDDDKDDGDDRPKEKSHNQSEDDPDDDKDDSVDGDDDDNGDDSSDDDKDIDEDDPETTNLDEIAKVLFR